VASHSGIHFFFAADLVALGVDKGVILVHQPGESFSVVRVNTFDEFEDGFFHVFLIKPEAFDTIDFRGLLPARSRAAPVPVEQVYLPRTVSPSRSPVDPSSELASVVGLSIRRHDRKADKCPTQVHRSGARDHTR